MEIKPRLFLPGGKKSRSTPAFKYGITQFKPKTGLAPVVSTPFPTN